MLRIHIIGLLLSLTLSACARHAPHIQTPSWEVNDLARPQPPRITPGEFSTQDRPGTPPSDAVVLFDGHDLSHWRGEKGEPQWLVNAGVLEIKPHSGSIATKESFGDCQLHIEWQTPPEVKGAGQARGNSGVFLMSLFEVQVLDTHENRTYADGMAGSIYGQYPPIVNAAGPAGQWQVYDILFRRPRVNANGTIATPAIMTVLFNGVVVQDHMKLIGPTNHHILATWQPPIPTTGPLMLQDHGAVVRYRNIWIRNLPEEKEVAPIRASSTKE